MQSTIIFHTSDLCRVIYDMDLQLFAEEGGTADSGFAATSAEGSEDVGSEQAAPAPEQEETFDSLIKGRYKAEYSQHVQDAINKRFKNQRDNQELMDKMNPVLTMMAQRYGIAPDAAGNVDMDVLQQAIMDDNSMYEEEAFQRGMSVEDLKHMKQLEMDNAQLMRQHEQSLREEQARKAWDELKEQGEQLKQIYPRFDIGIEMQNPEFGRLIAVNVPLRTAYEIVHHDEIMEGGMQYAVQQTKENISKSIQSGSRRPAENGTRNVSPADTGSLDPSKLTRKDFARIKQAAQRGERITFT